MEMSTVVVNSGTFADLLRVSVTGSLIYLGEFPHSSWGIDLEGEIFIIQHDAKVYQVGEQGELQSASPPLPRLGESFQVRGRNDMRRGMMFSVFQDGHERMLGLHECSDWHSCCQGIAYVSGDKFYILVIKSEDEE